MLLRQELQTKRAGFTLMEIMVVVAIILILASSGIVVYMTMLGQAKIDRAKMDVKSLETAVSTYMTRHAQYPQSLQDLTVPDPYDGSGALLTEAALLDPWKQPYQYEPNNLNATTRKPRIYSHGDPANPVPISNWGADTIAGR